MKINNIAIITARGGSKRIPKKNIKDFFGKPIISYSIIAAIESNIFDKVMVSTDSDEIKEVAIRYGAEVPFMRSEKTANDFATTRDVLLEVIDEYKNIGIEFDKFACIYPTAPFITSELLKDAYKKFIDSNASSLLPVVKFSFPPQRGVLIRNNLIVPFDEMSMPIRSQDLEPIYHDCGQFYFYKTSDFINTNKTTALNTVPYIMEEKYVQDIDTIDDWEMAECKFRVIKNEIK